MKQNLFPIAVLAVILFTGPGKCPGQNWLQKPRSGYNLYYTTPDKPLLPVYETLLDNGCLSVTTFFGEQLPHPFDVYIHPNRHSLDSIWSIDWQSPGFKSECWMVASGVARKLDLLSFLQWNKEACEHSSADSVAAQKLITHELVHVYHGQHNASPDFSDVSGIDWFVEGLATLASGQYDSTRIREVKALVHSEKSPASLDDFWTGQLRYGLSGSMVQFIEVHYGHKKLLELIPFNRKEQIMQTLGTTESELLQAWKVDMR
jgi:hypothetical protein